MKKYIDGAKTKRRDLLKTLAVSSVALVSGGIKNFTFAMGGYNVKENYVRFGPDDGANVPIGTPVGIFPGRVVWSYDPAATNPACTNHYPGGDFYFMPGYYDQQVIGKMFTESLQELTGKKTVSKAWDAMFKFFNEKKHGKSRGYKEGEKIFIKLNQTAGRGTLTPAMREAGKYYYLPYNPESTRAQTAVCETSPPVVLELLRHLVKECGIRQSDISVGDPQNPTWGHNYDIWHAEFPDVVYTDCMYGTHGRTLIKAVENDLMFYSDKMQTDKLYNVIVEADYMINIPNLKPHGVAGITITAKNHFGSHSRPRADHLHYALPKNSPGYGNYRVFVDILGNKYLGQNTLLSVVEGLWGGGSSVTGAPVKYLMEPFNNNWCNSLFVSLDQVALDSVCYDFLRTEWDGVNKHDPINNRDEASPNMYGVDDYLHQAADSEYWPEGLMYDPNNTGQPIGSLGVHEHWNNPRDKQYSVNLGTGRGIELVSIPESLVKGEA